ncbi:zinc finger CCCH domain-containing protein 41, partial [Tanacetum coccineum]
MKLRESVLGRDGSNRILTPVALFFAERGLPTVSNFYGPSWSSYGLVPELPNSGLDMHHLLGLQGTFRPDIDPSFNMGLARQWCRDFEEQGFCLRGDMCPMEHGLNRIVVEDVLVLNEDI